MTRVGLSATPCNGKVFPQMDAPCGRLDQDPGVRLIAIFPWLALVLAIGVALVLRHSAAASECHRRPGVGGQLAKRQLFPRIATAGCDLGSGDPLRLGTGRVVYRGRFALPPSRCYRRW